VLLQAIHAVGEHFELISRLHLPDLAGWCLDEFGLWGFIGGVGLGLGCVVYWVSRHLALGVLGSDIFQSTLC
jgi:hypothetical protein